MLEIRDSVIIANKTHDLPFPRYRALLDALTCAKPGGKFKCGVQRENDSGRKKVLPCSCVFAERFNPNLTSHRTNHPSIPYSIPCNPLCRSGRDVDVKRVFTAVSRIPSLRVFPAVIHTCPLRLRITTHMCMSLVAAQLSRS